MKARLKKLKERILHEEELRIQKEAKTEEEKAECRKAALEAIESALEDKELELKRLKESLELERSLAL